MVLQPEEPKISLSGIHHFARAASEFESSEGVFLFPELRIISTITREVEPEGEGDEDPTGDSREQSSLPQFETAAETPLWLPGKNPGPFLLWFWKLECFCAVLDLLLESDCGLELLPIFGNPLMGGHLIFFQLDIRVWDRSWGLRGWRPGQGIQLGDAPAGWQSQQDRLPPILRPSHYSFSPP